jgi:hypothetical protein
MIRHIDTRELISVGAVRDSLRFKITDLLHSHDTSKGSSRSASFLSGRGSMYPAKEFLLLGRSNESLTPQYFADYLISHRFAIRGFDLVLHSDVFVLSDENFGNMAQYNFYRKYFYARSSNYFIARLYFDWVTLPALSRVFYPFLVILNWISKLVNWIHK